MQADNAEQEILARLGIAALNDMQLAAHKAIVKEPATVLLSPTGSGKTVAYLLPILQGLKKNKKGVQCLVLVPSRELALQTEQVWKTMATGYKVNSCYGGHSVETEINNLSEPPALLIGTPGRIMDHLVRGSFDTASVATLVLDEFDKSLSLGFEGEMSFIIGKLQHIRKRVLLSATNAVQIPGFTGIYEPRVIDFIAQPTEGRLETRKVLSPEKDKIQTLIRLLSHIGGSSAIIFINHREAAERIGGLLLEAGIPSAVFHGGMEQPAREQALARFRNGSVHFLVATDLAARGLDIPLVEHVIHYHIPGTRDEYVHRNGRTARMHATGTAYLLLHAEEHVPEYIEAEPELLEPQEKPLPQAPEWTTVYITGGKKDKISKSDIAGFLMKSGGLAKDELGMIEVRDHDSFAAVKNSKVKPMLQKVAEQKLKGKKYKTGIAK